MFDDLKNDGVVSAAGLRIPASVPIPRFPIFHIPHTGEKFPPELLSFVCVTDKEFRYYHGLFGAAAR